MECYRVLIADDHPLARAAVRSILEEDRSFELVGEADNGKGAFQLCGELDPDLILMDINMPVWDGLEATRRIKHFYPQVRIVMLTVSDDAADLFTALQLGAQGYLLKNMESQDWLSYLRSLMREDTEFSRQMAGKLLCRFKKGNQADGLKQGVLTPREREVLNYVGQGYTNKQLAKKLFITENTAKNHIKNILEKLLLHNRVQLAAYAVHYGLTV